MANQNSLNSEESERYARQMILPEIGEAGQLKLRQACVVVIGAGGLGAPVLLYLAAAGVGRIEIVDPDKVDISNLQRQVLYSSADVGQPKALVAARKLRELNPLIQVTAHVERLEAQNALRLFSEADCVVDGTDNFATKFLINDAAVKAQIPAVYGSILRFEGQVSVFNFNGGPCYRCLYPEPPRAQVLNCAEAGVLGAVGGVIGSLQALEAIKIILAGSNSAMEVTSGALLVFDALTMTSRKFGVRRRADCSVCSRPPLDIELKSTEPQFCVSEVAEIDAETALTLSGVRWIDVREEAEWRRGRIPGAEHWPLSRLEKGERPRLTPDQTNIIYCQSGVRSKRAAALLTAEAVKVTSLRSGLARWPGALDAGEG